jgi:hypothetical protein
MYIKKWILFIKVRNEWIEKNAEEEGYRIIYWKINSAHEGKKIIDIEKKTHGIKSKCGLVNEFCSWK